MRYQGSKRRIAEEIYKVMQQYHKSWNTWVEPFVGGGNMISFVKGKRIVADVNKHVINALKMIRDNLDLIPKNNSEFTKEDYLELKEKYKKGESSELIGFAGFAYSFGAMEWGSWAAANNRNRDYVSEALNSAKIQTKKLKGVELINVPYQNLEIPDKSIIYCDPPYQNTAGYKNSFNHSEFWEWCRVKQKEGHNVFISEYNAPPDFVSIWSKELTVTLSKSSYKTNTEHLFVHKSFNVKIGMFYLDEI